MQPLVRTVDAVARRHAIDPDQRLVERGQVDHPRDMLTLDDQADQYRPARQPAHQRARPVDRIEAPADRRARACRAIFLAPDAMVGERFLDAAAQRALGGAVGFGNGVVAALALLSALSPAAISAAIAARAALDSRAKKARSMPRLKAPRPLDRKARARLGPRA